MISDDLKSVLLVMFVIIVAWLFLHTLQIQAIMQEIVQIKTPTLQFV